MNWVVKCNKCGHKCQTVGQFDKEAKDGKWFITSDGWTWGYEHDCQAVDK